MWTKFEVMCIVHRMNVLFPLSYPVDIRFFHNKRHEPSNMIASRLTNSVAINHRNLICGRLGLGCLQVNTKMKMLWLTEHRLNCNQFTFATVFIGTSWSYAEDQPEWICIETSTTWNWLRLHWTTRQIIQSATEYETRTQRWNAVGTEIAIETNWSWRMEPAVLANAQSKVHQSEFGLPNSIVGAIQLEFMIYDSQEKEAFVVANKVDDSDTMSADKMSEFYKKFLDENWQTHFTYNKQWYKLNFELLLLHYRTKFQLQRLFRRWENPVGIKLANLYHIIQSLLYSCLLLLLLKRLNWSDIYVSRSVFDKCQNYLQMTVANQSNHTRARQNWNWIARRLTICFYLIHNFKRSKRSIESVSVPKPVE